MYKKDLGLAVLVITVGAIVTLVNPRFVSPINLANTANLIGLFGLFSIAEAFVIATAGIELSIGSVIALLGVIFIDLIASHGVPWPVAFAIVLALSVVIVGALMAPETLVVGDKVENMSLLSQPAMMPAG